MQPRSGSETARSRAEQMGWDLTDCLALSEGHSEGDDEVVVALFSDRILAHKPASVTQASGAIEGGQNIPMSSVEGASATKDGDLTKLAIQAAGNTYSYWLPDGDAEAMRAELTRLVAASSGEPPQQDAELPTTEGYPRL